ncbi:MAG: ATP-binding cassette domain-containing protein [Anaerolineae bacterium]|nr:ATP-binding cassette domain-containing protein [Anaerolineae bacterium]
MTTGYIESADQSISDYSSSAPLLPCPPASFSPSPYIHFEHVTYTYPGASQPALYDVNFVLPEGGVTLLIGPSGVGKSTLLRCLNGLVPHFSGGTLSGRITVGDLDPVVATPKVMSRQVGFVFQDPEAQFVLDCVEDEIAFALENAGMPRNEMRERVDEVLIALELDLLRDRKLEMLSGGEKQRVAIAAALALRPRILVLDEPTSQLDPQSAEEVLQALVRLKSEFGLTIVLAEHRLERVLAFTDTLIYLPDAGQPLQVGSPAEVLGHYSDMALIPPVVALGKALGWSPLPLTVEQGRHFVRKIDWLRSPLADRQFYAPPSYAPYLVAQKLDVGYQEYLAVLHQVHLTLYPGEIVALMGRNGSGKTTLLKTLVGLLRPQQGHVYVEGRSIARQSVAEVCRRVGYLPQDPNALLFADTVRDELRITLHNHNLDEWNGPVELNALLARLGLTGKADAYPRDLSVGERQRVAMGAIMITRPGALLLDEPTRGLDYGAKQQLADLLWAWRNDVSMVDGAPPMAILVATHDVELVAAIADRVVVLEGGYVVADGPPAQVFGSPQTASLPFIPQIARLFPDTGWLTVAEALAGLRIP